MLTPVGDGRLEVYANRELIFDRKAEEGVYPDLLRVRVMRKALREKLTAVRP